MAELDVYGGYNAAQTRRRNAVAQGQRGARNELVRRELTRDRTTGEIIYDTAAAGLQGAVTLGEAAYGLGNLATGGLLEGGLGLAENFERTNEIIQNSKSRQLRFQAQQNERTFEEEGIVAGVTDFVTNPALLADLAVSQAPSILPAAAGGTFAASRVLQGAAARGMTKEATSAIASKAATRAAVLTGGAQMGGTAYTSAYNQAIEEGLSPSEANARALVAGYGTAAAGIAISKLPGVGAAGAEGSAAARVAGVPQAAGSFTRQVGGATRREATEEYLQSGAEEMIQNTVSERKQLMDGVAKNAAMGAVGGGLLGAGMGVVPAASDFRADLKRVMDESASDAGVSDLAETELQRQGEAELRTDAAQERTIKAAAERLVSLGFVANDDGTFSKPGDPLYDGQILTLDEALDVAAEQDITMDQVPMEQPTGQIPVPEVGEIAGDQDGEPLPTMEVDDGGIPLPLVEEEQTGYRAFRKATDLLRQAGAEYQVVDGQAVFRTESVEDGVPTVADISDEAGIEIARRMNIVSENEAAEAMRYVRMLRDRRSDPNSGPLKPRSQTPVTEETALTASEVQAQQEYEAQEVALRDAEYFADDDGTYWVVDDEGNDQQLTREQALQNLGYVPQSQDLLGDPVFTPVEPEPAEMATGPDAEPAEQYTLRGIDPLFEAVDDANRKAAGMVKLQQLAQTPELLPAPEGQDIRDGWSKVFDGAVEQRNSIVGASERINFTQSMRKSKLLRDFVEDAVSNNIQPGSPESFDFIAEKARAAEVSDAKSAQVIAAVADMAGAVEPGTASLIRWKKALMRKGIAKQGQMKGPAYSAFKDAVEKATITPGSVEFDTFMQNFSASLTEEQAATTFGQNIRTAYPYSSPEVAEAKAKTAKQKQVTKGAPRTRKDRKPVIGEGVAPLMKTAREKALTEPSPEPATEEARAAEAPVKKQKRKVRETLNRVSKEAAPAISTAERDIQRTRNAALIEEDDSGEVDPDVAAAEREAGRPRQPAISEAVNLEINQIVYDVQRRISQLSQMFASEVMGLRAQYGGKAATEAGKDAAAQEALTDAITKRMLAVDSALTKDAGNVAAWGGIVGTIINSNQFRNYANNDTAYNQLIKPAMDRFANMVTDAQTADGVRIYRAVLQDVGVEAYINDQLTGKTKTLAKKQMDALNRFMDTAIERMSADPSNEHNVNVFKTNGQKYSLAPDSRAATRMPRDELDAIVDEWNLNRPPTSTPFVVYDTAEEAQAALGMAVPASANGIYYMGRAYVIAENVTDAQMAREVILHERTHGGLEALLGADRLNAVMNRVWANAQLRRRTQAKMKAHNLNRIQAAEEVVVDMVVNGEQLNKSLFSKIRAAVSRMAESVFGVTDYVAPDSMVNEMLKDTADYLRGEKSELNLSESYVEGLQAYQAVFEGKSVLKSPMFSMAVSELERVTSGETSDMGRFQTMFQRANAETLSNNWKAKVKGGGQDLISTVGRVTMDMLPASQIVALNQGLFYYRPDNATGVDLLKQFNRDKLAKENEFNKVIQNKRKTYYAYGTQGQQTFEESAMDVADDWGKLTRSRGAQDQATAMNEVSQMGTMFKVYPDRTWDEQTKLDYSRENFTEADRRNAYKQVRDQWNKMTDGPQGTKQLYRRTQAIYANLWSERMAEVSKQADRIAEASTEMPDPDQPTRSIPSKEWRGKMNRKISTAMNRIKEGPYSPLQRFGDHYVVVRDPDGNVVFSSGHDSIADADAMVASMKQQGLGEGYTIAAAERTSAMEAMGGLSQQHYDQIRTALAGVFPGSNESDTRARTQALAAMEEVMLMSLPDHSLLKHANARKGIAGATPDAFRAYNDYVIKSARNLASMRYDHRIQGALNEMRKMTGAKDETALNRKRDRVFDAISRQHLASQQASVNALSTFATSTAFMMYMTSPSQLFLNASQTALVTMPVLAAKYGIGDTLKYTKEAFTEAMRAKGMGMHSDSGKLDPNSVMANVMQSLNADGTLDFTQSHDLSDMAQRESDLMHSKWRQVTHAASSFMRLSEVFNRETAAYVVVRGEMRKAGMTDESFRALPEQRRTELLEQWTNAARDAVEETQFIYNQSNKARYMQGNVGRIVFQFQQFRVNMLALIGRTIRDSFFAIQDPSLSTEEKLAQKKLARKMLAYMTGTQLVLTGMASSVFAPIAYAAFDLMDMLDDDDDLLSAEEKFLQFMPEVMSMGLVGQVLDPQRFGFNTLLPVFGGTRYMPASDDPQKTFDHILLNSLGPMYGIGSQMLDGAQTIADGDVFKGIVNMTPKPISDLFKVAVTEQTQMTDRQGIPYYERTPADMVANALGLRTSDQAVMQADRSAIYSGTQRASDRRSKLVFDYVTAADSEERADAVQKVANWNRQWGGDSSLVINNSTLKRAAKTRVEKEQNARLYGVPSTRTPDAVRRLVDG